MSDLRITTIQSTLQWEDIPANLSHFTHLFAGLEGQTDLVVLPEMFSTGFSMNPAQLAEPMEGPTIGWMREQAVRLGAALCGSLIIEEEGKYYNRLVWMDAEGNSEVYDKRHLFGLGGEAKDYAAGNQRLIVDYKGWKICPLICYDLRFPVWSRNTEAYDLLIYLANWPKPRASAWRTLLRARAIENQAYVIGVNRIGEDGSGLSYRGDTAVIDFMGEALYQVSYQEDVFTTSLSYADMHALRKKLPFLADRDHFDLR
ncbi:MAG: amidohydrolase [Bacteroidota bacterium]